MTPPPETVPQSSSLDARRAALAALVKVLDRRETLDAALNTAPGFTAMEGRDRAFARLLVMTALRRHGELDSLIASALDKPLAKSARAIRHVLALGICQLLMLGTPPHAAVDTSVRLAAGIAGGRFKGLTNAVLRRMGREGADRLAALDGPRVNTPDWLWELCEKAYGAGAARAIASVHGQEPPLDLTLRDPIEAGTWIERLAAAGIEAENPVNGTLRLRNAGRIEALPGFEAGAWWVQDAAAALPVRVMSAGDAATLWGRRVLDLCAAPGGKTLQLVAAGARVTAVDQSAERLRRVAANLARLGLSAELIAADGRDFEAPAPFDFVLLDAPCSATGTIRRHPDLPHIKGAEDAKRMFPLQDQLLARAADLTAPGGTLVYTVCSLDPGEGADRVAQFLATRDDFRRSAINAGACGIDPDWLAPGGDLRTLPFHLGDRGGMDGFFAAVFKRNLAAL
jgi:16S rRNA (cytosine967-C5)-methyltransferase